MKFNDRARVPQLSFNCSQQGITVSVPGDYAQRCLAVVAKPHFPVEPVRGRAEYGVRPYILHLTGASSASGSLRCSKSQKEHVMESA
jgi:hypothetical protein